MSVVGGSQRCVVVTSKWEWWKLQRLSLSVCLELFSITGSGDTNTTSCAETCGVWVRPLVQSVYHIVAWSIYRGHCMVLRLCPLCPVCSMGVVRPATSPSCLDILLLIHTNVLHSTSV